LKRGFGYSLVFAVCGLAGAAYAHGNDRHEGDHGPGVDISFIEVQSLDLTKQPPQPLIVKGKLQIPRHPGHHNGFRNGDHKLPAVVILHGSAGVDSRGDFYAEALNDAGIATLAIDMWEARKVSVTGRPKAPILTLPDAFAALRYLANLPNIDADRIGVIGFSWGGVMTLGSAEQLYAAQFGRGLTFAAHVANYPVCYGANDPRLVYPLSPAAAGTQFLNLTGAPMLIQIGTEDDYDNGAQHCLDLAASVNSAGPVDVEVYEGAYHAFDRIQVPISEQDPFGNEGSILTTGVVPTVQMVPNVEQAYRSRHRVVEFFTHTLQ